MYSTRMSVLIALFEQVRAESINHNLGISSCLVNHCKFTSPAAMTKETLSCRLVSATHAQLTVHPLAE